MKEYIEIILTVLGFVIVLLITIIGWIARKYILRLEVVEKRVEQIEQCIKYDLGPNHIFRSGCPTCTYHFYVDQQGEVDHAVSVYLKTIHAGVQNSNSIAICINHGGESNDIIEKEQYAALIDTICYVMDFMDWDYSLQSVMERIHFHRDYSPKLCPGANLNKADVHSDVAHRLKTWGDNV